MSECPSDGLECSLSECASGCCEARAHALKLSLPLYLLSLEEEQPQTPTQIIEELTAPQFDGLREGLCIDQKPLYLLQGSDTPAHANAQAPVRTAQVIRWRGITKLDLPADQVLGAALEAGLKCAIVIGYTSDEEEYFASSLADGADALWLLERLKMRLLTGSADPDEV